jgi:ABC-2 type transport system ATP-binding protein
MQDILNVVNLSKRYGSRQAVAALNFHIYQGEIFGLLGPNGAGKTTTIGMLTGLVDPSGGQVIIDGLDLRQNPLKAKAKIGFVPQDFAFYPTLSARDNLIFFGRIYGLHGRLLRQRIVDTLDMVELTDRAGHAVSTFSHGMKRRLNIAIGLLHHPRILILDEPTAGVDAHMRQTIFENLKALNKRGLTAIYTTHLMQEAQHLCHRVAIMDKGNIIATDTPSALMAASGKGIIRIRLSKPALREQMEPLAELGSLTLLDSTVFHIQLTADTADNIFENVAVLAQKADISIKGIDILEPSLESVFLHLTGRSAMIDDASFPDNQKPGVEDDP